MMDCTGHRAINANDRSGGHRDAHRIGTVKLNAVLRVDLLSDRVQDGSSPGRSLLL